MKMFEIPKKKIEGMSFVDSTKEGKGVLEIHLWVTHAEAEEIMDRWMD